MNAAEVARAMGAVQAHWPNAKLTEAQLDAWRRTLQRFDLSDTLGVLDEMRSGTHTAFVPDAGAVLEALQSLARRRAVARAEGRGDGATGAVTGSPGALERIAELKGRLVADPASEGDTRG